MKQLLPKEIAQKIIDSHAIALFQRGDVIYDKNKNLPEAVNNAIIMVETQIDMLKRGEEFCLVHEVEEYNTLELWEEVLKEIDK